MGNTRRRKGQTGPGLLVVGLFALGALITAARWLVAQAEHYWYVTVLVGLLALGVGAALSAAAIARQRERRERLARLRYTPAQLDALSPSGFEAACAALLARDGFTARVVGGAGDRSADVIGRDTAGLTVVLQCKHTTVGSRVGSPVLYGLNGTLREIHRADLGVVVTNGGFTRDAPTVAAQLARIRLVDRAALQRWATGGESFHHLLGLDRPRLQPQG